MTTDYLPYEKYNLLFPNLQYENYLVLKVSLETGLRVGDIVALPASALQGRKISYTSAKTKKEGVATVSAELAAKLRGISGNDFIFNGKGSSGHRTRQTVWRDVKQAAKIAGLRGNIAPHSARKTFAVEEFHKRGFSATSRALQHSNASTTMLYAFSDVFSAAGGCASYCSGQACPLQDVDEFAELVADKVVEKLKSSL